MFIQEGSCERYAEDEGFPPDVRKHPLTFNAYARGRVLRAQVYVTDGCVEPVIERLLARPDVDYVHVRDTRAGCFGFRVERASRR